MRKLLTTSILAVGLSFTATAGDHIDVVSDAVGRTLGQNNTAVDLVLEAGRNLDMSALNVVSSQNVIGKAKNDATVD